MKGTDKKQNKKPNPPCVKKDVTVREKSQASKRNQLYVYNQKSE